MLVIALDGKTVRGARTGEGKAPHLLAAMITGARAVIAQRDVDVKTNEITQVRPLLDDVGTAGALVTADAPPVQKDTARYLVEDKGADYLFTAVKENQPGLFAALDALAWRDVPVAHACRTGATAGTKPAPSRSRPPRAAAFPHAAQAVLVERLVRDPRDGRLRSAVAALGITSRAAARGGTPEALAIAVRGHWDVEALHHVRDVTMKEDASRLRSGTSPQVTAAIRNTVIAALRLAGFTGTAAGTTLGRTQPRPDIGSLESHITRMTKTLPPEVTRAYSAYAGRLQQPLESWAPYGPDRNTARLHPAPTGRRASSRANVKAKKRTGGQGSAHRRASERQNRWQ